MARDKQPTKRIHQMTISEWEAAFPDEDACCLYLAEHRWPEFVVCPRCGNPEVKAHGTIAWNWLCNVCAPPATNYRFSHIVGTVFENTNKPLRQWFRVIHLMLTSKKGISALQIHRMMGFGSYRTAWYMCHRIRAALANEDFRKLMGINDKRVERIWRREGLKVPIRQPKRARLWLNDGSCIRLRAERATTSGPTTLSRSVPTIRTTSWGPVTVLAKIKYGWLKSKVQHNRPNLDAGGRAVNRLTASSDAGTRTLPIRAKGRVCVDCGSGASVPRPCSR